MVALLDAAGWRDGAPVPGQPSSEFQPERDLSPTLLPWLHWLGLGCHAHQLMQLSIEQATLPAEETIALLTAPPEHKAQLLLGVQRMREFIKAGAAGAESKSAAKKEVSGASAAGEFPADSSLRATKEAEDRLRALFVSDPTHAALKDPLLLLSDAFSAASDAAGKSAGRGLYQTAVSALEAKGLGVLPALFAASETKDKCAVVQPVRVAVV